MNTNIRYKPWQAYLGEFDFNEDLNQYSSILAFDYTKTIFSPLAVKSGDCAVIPKWEDPPGISHLINCSIPLTLTVRVLS